MDSFHLVPFTPYSLFPWRFLLIFYSFRMWHIFHFVGCKCLNADHLNSWVYTETTLNEPGRLHTCLYPCSNTNLPQIVSRELNRVTKEIVIQNISWTWAVSQWVKMVYQSQTWWKKERRKERKKKERKKEKGGKEGRKEGRETYQGNESWIAQHEG